MRINSAVVFTFILLSLMIGAGVVSSAWGYRLGREALKGITQPDTRPTNNMARRNSNGEGTLVFLKESDILAEVQARMEGRTGPITAQRQQQAQQQQQAAAPVAADESAPANSDQFPIKAEDRGVTFEVQDVRRQGATLILDVKMQNTGVEPFEFLYSFMNVTDENGQSLSVSTEGLPTEIEPESPVFAGEVRVPADLLQTSKSLSLTLTDYPDQRLRLQLDNIPVAQ
ncbi:MAG: hypothetical protein ACTS2F_14285 [Thainema sp.]